MPVDSVLVAAVTLFAASITAWHLSAPLRAASRLYLRFAAVLLAALAVCAVLRLGEIAALFLLPLVAGSLLLAASARFARKLPELAATCLLVGALACGLGAVLSDWPMLAILPMVLAGLAIIAAALGGLAFLGAAGGVALLAAAFVFFQQGIGAGMLLFSAAALVGLARPRSAPAIDQQPFDQRVGPRRRHAIGSLR